MDKFVFIQPPLMLGNPFLEDSFLRSCIYRLIPEHNHQHITDDLLRFGQRCITDLHAKANDAELHPPELVQTNVYGKRVDEIHTTFGWKFQQEATANEGLISIPYPMVTPSGTVKTLGDADINHNGCNSEAQHDMFSFTGRLHAFVKNSMYTPSSGMFACPNAMTDGATLLLLTLLTNPRLFGPMCADHSSATSPHPSLAAAMANSSSLHYNSMSFSEQLMMKLVHFCLSLLTNRSASSPLQSFQPSLEMLPKHPDFQSVSSTASSSAAPVFTAAGRPPFSTSGQWMTEQKSGSDVNYASTCLAFPLYSSNIHTATPGGSVHDRLFSLYGLKWFTSAIDSKLTVTLARVITRETWVQATQKLDKKYKTNRFTQLAIPHVLQSGGQLVLDPDSVNASVYDNVLQFQTNVPPLDDSMRNTGSLTVLQYLSSVSTASATRTKAVGIAHTDVGTILQGIDPHSEIIRSIPLTCFLLLVKDDWNRLNNIHIQRLKDKLGTRQLPTAELLLRGTIALRLSDYGRGIPLIAIMFNLTRIHNSISAIGYTNRLLSLNRDYMLKRFVFGSLLSQNATHLNTMSVITSKTWLLGLSTFEISFLQGVSDALSTMRYVLSQSLNPSLHQASPSTQQPVHTTPHKALHGLHLIKDRLIEIIQRVYITVCLPFSPFKSSDGSRITSPQEFITYLTNIHHPVASTLLEVIHHIQFPVSSILRSLTPLIKLCTAETAADISTQLMQLLGALGYMEDSNVPRNVRDVAVLSIWEGSTAVVSEDFLRAVSVKHGVVNVPLVEFIFSVILHRLVYAKQWVQNHLDSIPNLIMKHNGTHPPHARDEGGNAANQHHAIPSLFKTSTPAIIQQIIETVYTGSRDLLCFLTSPATGPQQLVLHSIAISRSVFMHFFMASLLVHCLYYLDHASIPASKPESCLAITPPAFIDTTASNYSQAPATHTHSPQTPIVLSLPSEYGYRILYAIYRLAIDTPYETLSPQFSRHDVEHRSPLPPPSASPMSSTASLTASRRLSVVTNHLMASELSSIAPHFSSPQLSPAQSGPQSMYSRFIASASTLLSPLSSFASSLPGTLHKAPSSSADHTANPALMITRVINDMNRIVALDHVDGLDLNVITRTPL